jgi:diguanylate cyclase (GGDEF)-like protein
MHHRNGITLTTLMLIVFVIIGVGSSVLLRTTMKERQHTVVSQLGSQESQRTAEQIFQHLYSVMRAGWTRAELEETVGRIARVYPDIQIRLVRSEAVARQYGDHVASSHARRDDPRVSTALASGKPGQIETETMLRYLLPVANQAECRSCHDNAEGSVNGLIDIRIPPERLRAPIQATLSPLVNLISLLIVVIFAAVFLLLRNQIVRPIVQLSHHVTRISRDLDSATGVGIRHTWPREIRQLAGQFNRLLREIHASHDRLRELAVRDRLTGLYNRLYFDEMMARTLDQAERKQQPVCLLMLDLDNFKPINDRHGHAMGDQVLADVARTIQGLTRTGDICSRVGGDEFLIISADCDADAARTLADRVSSGVAALSWPGGDETVRVDASVGVAIYPTDAQSVEQLLACADRAMYADKRARREAAQG